MESWYTSHTTGELTYLQWSVRPGVQTHSTAFCWWFRWFLRILSTLKIYSASSLHQSLLKKLNSIVMSQSRSCRQLYLNISKLQIRKFRGKNALFHYIAPFIPKVQNRVPALEIKVPKRCLQDPSIKYNPCSYLEKSTICIYFFSLAYNF